MTLLTTVAYIAMATFFVLITIGFIITILVIRQYTMYLTMLLSRTLVANGKKKTFLIPKLMTVLKLVLNKKFKQEFFTIIFRINFMHKTSKNDNEKAILDLDRSKTPKELGEILLSAAYFFMLNFVFYTVEENEPVNNDEIISKTQELRKNYGEDFELSDLILEDMFYMKNYYEKKSQIKSLPSYYNPKFNKALVKYYYFDKQIIGSDIFKDLLIKKCMSEVVSEEFASSLIEIIESMVIRFDNLPITKMMYVFNRFV